LNARLNHLVDRAKNPRDKNFRNHLYIFLICCGISLFIWFLIKMSDDYVSDLSIPVTFNNVPADKQLNNTTARLDVRMRANGSDLFSVKYFSGRKEISVNLNQVDMKISRYFDKYYILTDELRQEIIGRFDFDHTLISISPDTIYLDLEDIISRSLPVVPDLSFDFKPQYMLYDSIIISPAEIMVSGPASAVDTLSSITTASRVLSNLHETTELSVPIVPAILSNKIRYSDTEVNVIIPVEQFTEHTIEIPIKGISDDTGILNVRTFPETVQLTYRVAIKDYQLVKPEMFVLSATYDPQRDMEKTFLKVRTDQSPEYVQISRIHPDKVEFIIQK